MTTCFERATPAEENKKMSLQIVNAPNGAKLYTYDTAEEIPGYSPHRINTGQIVQIPAGGTGGGRWMVVSPFNLQPWDPVAEVAPLPAGFEAIIGPKPNSNSYHGAGYPKNYQQALVTWETNLKTYVDGSLPPGSNDAKVAAARSEAIKYEMGEPAYYQNTHGHQVRFPESQAENFQANGVTFINTGTGQIIVNYQNKITNMGIVINDPPGLHTLAPPELARRQNDLRKAEAVT